jgi:hypothetical protein
MAHHQGTITSTLNGHLTPGWIPGAMDGATCCHFGCHFVAIGTREPNGHVQSSAKPAQRALIPMWRKLQRGLYTPKGEQEDVEP